MFSTVLMGKPKLRMEFIKIIKKSFKFLLGMSPDEKMSSVYLNHTNGWCYWVFGKFKFNLIHEDGRIWWCKLSSDSHSWNLLFNFSVKFKIVILEDKFSQLNKIVSEDLLRLFFLELLLMPSNQARAWYYDTVLQHPQWQV